VPHSGGGHGGPAPTDGPALTGSVLRPASGGPTTVTGGGVRPSLNQFKFKWFNSIQIFPNFDQSEKHISLHGKF
jgi:hypothetical protein